MAVGVFAFRVREPTCKNLGGAPGDKRTVAAHEGKCAPPTGPRRVAIGRALQPFPRSKPGVRLSPHPAFRLGRRTGQGRTRRHRRCGAPVGLMVAYRHLLSARHPFAGRSVGLPWRTFTVSCPLPAGVWLLRRLRPPVRMLACSHPLPGQGGVGVPQFQCERRGSDP